MRLLAILAVAVLVVACSDDDDEELVPDGLETEPIASVPVDWPTYTNPDGLFSLRHPPDWHELDNAFYSYDPTEDGSKILPPEEVKVEVNYYQAKGSTGCFALDIDPETGEVSSVEPGATESTLGGEPAWDIVRTPPEIQEPATRAHSRALVREGLCMGIVAYFTQETPDESLFSQIASTLEFGP
ncbi:MAG: hypothetical protein WD904_11155 [Dehalococcoidia bacterium]